jgi:hypothetical protein
VSPSKNTNNNKKNRSSRQHKTHSIPAKKYRLIAKQILWNFLVTTMILGVRVVMGAEVGGGKI